MRVYSSVFFAVKKLLGREVDSKENSGKELLAIKDGIKTDGKRKELTLSAMQEANTLAKFNLQCI